MKLDWGKAEKKLKAMLGRQAVLDIYMMLNVVAPLRDRYYNGERTLKLYNEIMSIRYPDRSIAG